MNEIVTFGRNYKLTPGIKVFVKSSKNFCDKLTIICSDLDANLTEFLKREGVNVIDANAIASSFNVDMNISPYTLKVIFFYLYCKHICKSVNVYLCDFTDIFIQKNLFEIIKNDKPYITCENVKIGNCETNKTWINVCYNSDIFNLLKNYEILNGGSILGNIFNVIPLLKEMCADMTQIISRIGNYPNIDQASLNKVVYFDQYRYNVLADREIFNLAHHGDVAYEINSKSISFSGYVPYVIHQYDVIKKIEKFLYEQV